MVPMFLKWPELAPHRPHKRAKGKAWPLAGRLAPWEVVTGVEEEALAGLLPRTWLLGLSALFAAFVAACWAPVLGGEALLAALVLGRLAALDATTYTLPHVYTVPLLCVGLAHALASGHFATSLLAVILLAGAAFVASRSQLRAQLGGGDVLLLMVLFAFLRPEDAFFAISLGCILWVPLVWAKPRTMVPMGLPLLLGWVLWVPLEPYMLHLLAF